MFLWFFSKILELSSRASRVLLHPDSLIQNFLLVLYLLFALDHTHTHTHTHELQSSRETLEIDPTVDLKK